MVRVSPTKVHLEIDVQLHTFLNSALDGGEWSASLPGKQVGTKVNMKGLKKR